MTTTTKIFRAIVVSIIVILGIMIMIKAYENEKRYYVSTNPKTIILKDLTDFKKAYKARQISGQSTKKYTC